MFDFGLYDVLGEHNLAELEPLAAAGAIGSAFPRQYHRRPSCPNDGAVLEGFEILASLGLALRHPRREFADPVLASRNWLYGGRARSISLGPLSPARTDVVAPGAR